MRINKNMTVFAGSDEQTKNTEGKRAHRKAMFAGNMNANQKSDRMQKKIQKERDAMKKVLEQFSTDGETDQKLDQLKTNVSETEKELVNAGKELSKVNEQLTELDKKKTESGIIEPSDTEQEGPTEEELQKQQEYWKEQVDELSKKKASASGTIEGIHTARLKADPMVGVGRTAEKEKLAASKEMVNGEMTDAFEEMKEEFDERIQKAQEKKKEEEELEEQRRAAAEEDERKAKNLEKTTENLIQVTDTNQQLDNQVKEILAKQKLLEEDLKGLAVDENL